MVDAALAKRGAGAEPSPGSPTPASRTRAPRAAQQRSASGEASAGHGLWAYCVTRADSPLPSDVAGVAGEGALRRVESHGLAAVVSPVPLEEFGAAPLRENLNDLDWLERVARAHEAVLDRLLDTTTIVPLRLCTIYEREASVREMLERERDSLTRALEALAGRQEWGVKLIVHDERLADEARSRSSEAAALEIEIDARTGGGAYMLRRRLERHLREAADGLSAELAEQVHARLQDWTGAAVVLAPQNPELSGHSGRMLLNAAYLVEAERVEELRGLVAELEERHSDLGASIELTGPWPPYNFVPGGDTAALT